VTTKFLIVGVLNTLVGYAIYVALLVLGFPYLAALLVATVSGVAFNYFSTSRLVFKTKGAKNVLYKFIFAYVLCYAVNVAEIELIIKLEINLFFGQLMCLPPNALLSWLLMNYWVYKNE
jgi:putative flippase GtrA